MFKYCSIATTKPQSHRPYEVFFVFSVKHSNLVFYVILFQCNIKSWTMKPLEHYFSPTQGLQTTWLLIVDRNNMSPHSTSILGFASLLHIMMYTGLRFLKHCFYWAGWTVASIWCLCCCIQGKTFASPHGVPWLPWQCWEITGHWNDVFTCSKSWVHI